MKILVTGGTGFIGQRLVTALAARGHAVVSASRKALEGHAHVMADFTKDADPARWRPRLEGVDVVVNAVGILRERGEQTFDAVHTHTPVALFDACVATGVKRIVQISALGADTGNSGYFRSKRAADERLAAMRSNWTIVQPSLVYGPGGTSARMFSTMASLPIIPVPGDGKQLVQPIHVDDLIAALVALCESDAFSRKRIALVGPQAMTYRAMIAGLRRSLGLGAPRFLPIPMQLMIFGARIAELMPSSLLDRETLAMLQAGNTAPVDATGTLLQRSPRPIETFIVPATARSQLLEAQLGWLLPLLRVSVALVWLWTAVVSFGVFPRADSLRLLERTGIPLAVAPLFLYGAAVFDLALGIATLTLRRRRMLWLVQIGLIVFYTLIITLRLPEFWLHPYGPILKNLPMLAALYLLYVLERPRWNT